jgi:hypothetical protein
MRCVYALAVILAFSGLAGATPPGTAFTYQGRLVQNGQPVNGNVNMSFALFDAPTNGLQVSGIIAILEPVQEGLFTQRLDFGAGILPYVERNTLWLQVSIGTAALSPRQEITAAPEALHATNADSASQAADLFTVTGAAGTIAFDTGGPTIGKDATLPGLKIQSRDIYMVGDANDTPGLHLGPSTGSPYLIPVWWCCMPAPTDGLTLGVTELQLGGPSAPTPTLRLGGASDPDIHFDRTAGSIIIHLRDVAIGDANDTQPRALRFGDPVSGPGIGTDPSVAGIIIHLHDLTIGAPGEASAKTLHFGYDPRDPTPSIGTAATNLHTLTLSASSAIRLDGSFVGMGLASTATPQFRLDLPNVAGAAGQGRANAWTTYSSRRWKENIKPIDGALDKIARIDGVTFDWKADQGGKHDIGFVAEDVGKVLPELVEWEQDGASARSLKYDRMTAVAIQGIKEQQREIESLRARNAELTTRLERLESIMAANVPASGKAVPR